MNPNPTTILFLSTGDAARGILAEALVRHKSLEREGRFTAISAGYKMAAEVDPQAIAVLRAEGIDTDGLHTKGWQEFYLTPRSILVDVIVTLSEEARLYCPKWPGDPVRVHWPVDDPMAATTPDAREWKFKKCFATLQNRVEAMLKQRTAQNPVELLLQLRNIAAVV
jgi:arsenate reductase